MEKQTFSTKPYELEHFIKPVGFKAAKVLIVEDDLSCQALWEYILDATNLPIECDWASSEYSADKMVVESLKSSHPYDLIISDIFLSGSGTGLDLFKKFGQSFKDRFILVSSAEAEKLHLFLSLDDSHPIYWKKPFAIEDCINSLYRKLKEYQVR